MTNLIRQVYYHQKKASLHSQRSCLNRTRVRLKHHEAVEGRDLDVGLNRTRVKLKLLRGLLPRQCDECLNRTRVELKPYMGSLRSNQPTVLIEPEWN